MKIDRKYRLPRIWSNEELKKFAHLFNGKVVNVSAWKDIDKQGDRYKNYFKNASEYYITNYNTEKKGISGLDNEILLNLEDDLPDELKNKFDVVFNHTVLEHVFDFHKAFANICLMSKDIVILVVPFLQEMHGQDYGDFWRFSPSAIKTLFEKNNMETIYLSYNKHFLASVYVFAIAAKNPDKWKGVISDKIEIENNECLEKGHKKAGCNSILNKIPFKLCLKNFFAK